MRSSPNVRILVPLLAAAVLLLPACSKEAPPAPAPPAPAVEPAPAPAPPPEPEPPAAGEWEETQPVEQSFLSAEEINARRLLKTIYFDFDRAEIRPDQRATLQANAAWLRDHPEVKILIEGHCDERGTREYNLALGDRRAKAARDYLISLGIAPERIETISYGEERPVAEGHNEEAWALNRRAEFVAVSGARTTG